MTLVNLDNGRRYGYILAQLKRWLKQGKLLLWLFPQASRIAVYSLVESMFSDVSDRSAA